MARWQTKVAVVIAIAGVAYTGDYAIARARGNAVATVEVAQYYAIPLKNGQTQFSFAGNKDAVCVESLFPHFSDRPCWYVRRHAEEWIRP